MILGSINAICPGHETNRLILEKIFSKYDNYKVLEEKVSNAKTEYNTRIFAGNI